MEAFTCSEVKSVISATLNSLAKQAS